VEADLTRVPGGPEGDVVLTGTVTIRLRRT
jgi:hypothetical protein